MSKNIAAHRKDMRLLRNTPIHEIAKSAKMPPSVIQEAIRTFRQKRAINLRKYRQTRNWQYLLFAGESRTAAEVLRWEPAIQEYRQQAARIAREREERRIGASNGMSFEASEKWLYERRRWEMHRTIYERRPGEFLRMAKERRFLVLYAEYGASLHSLDRILRSKGAGGLRMPTDDWAYRQEYTWIRAETKGG